MNLPDLYKEFSDLGYYKQSEEISDYHYENGLPVSITFSDGSELTFEYAPAYFFDVEGFVLPEV